MDTIAGANGRQVEPETEGGGVAERPLLPLEPLPEPVEGIWSDHDLFARYLVTLRFTGRVMGGVPQKPELIEAWLRQRLIGGDQELHAMLIETLADLGLEPDDTLSREELLEAAKRAAALRHGNTFRRDANGLFLAAYQVKAMLKEATNVAFPWTEGKTRWGANKKAAKAFVAEKVFVDEPRIYLGRRVPDGTEMRVGHVNGPRGRRSTLEYVDYVEQPMIACTLSSHRDEVTADQWREILLTGQREGLGSVRSMGYGEFRVTGFERV